VPESWLEHLAGAEAATTSDSDLLVDSLANTELENSSAIDSNQLSPAITSPILVNGEVLPAGGNNLPPEVNGNAVTSKVSGKAVTSEVGQNVVTSEVGRNVVKSEVGRNAVTSEVIGSEVKLSSEWSDINQKRTAQRNIQIDGNVLSKGGEEVALHNNRSDKSELLMAAKIPLNPMSEFDSKSQSEKFSDSIITKLQGPQNAHNPILDGSLSRVQPNAAAMSNVTNLPSSLSATVDLEQLSLSRPENASEWGKGLGDRVSWMINQKLNTASIRLDPPMLGKLEISILVKDDVTSVTINAQHAQTREMIENASYRLRDHLQEAGYQNVNVDVSNDPGQKQPGAENLADSATSEDFELSDQADKDEVDLVSGNYSSESLVDYFV
jgi:flagellar hook-length control protein FliK